MVATTGIALCFAALGVITGRLLSTAILIIALGPCSTRCQTRVLAATFWASHTQEKQGSVT